MNTSRKAAPANRYVALFRGINVGRAKRIAMADLRAILESLGYARVRTLLNSGNAVFDAPAEAPEKMAARIRAAVGKKLGIDALVVVKSAGDIAANRLAAVATDPSRLLVALAIDAPALAALSALATTQWKDDVVHVGKHAAYIWCADGFLESKAAVALLRDFAERGTTRNWATLEKINAMMQEE